MRKNGTLTPSDWDKICSRQPALYELSSFAGTRLKNNNARRKLIQLLRSWGVIIITGLEDAREHSSGTSDALRDLHYLSFVTHCLRNEYNVDIELPDCHSSFEFWKNKGRAPPFASEMLEHAKQASPDKAIYAEFVEKLTVAISEFYNLTKELDDLREVHSVWKEICTEAIRRIEETQRRLDLPPEDLTPLKEGLENG